MLRKTKAAFSLIEVLICIGILGLFLTSTVASVNAGKKYVVINKMDAALNVMAADICGLQEYAIFSGANKSRLDLHIDKKGYNIYYGNKLHKNRRLNYQEDGELYFKQKLTALKFTSEGTPSANYTYILKSKSFSKISRGLELQPISGRVVFKNIQ